MTTIIKFQPSGERRFPQEIVGESQYQDNLRSIVGHIKSHDYFKKETYTALLILEDKNPYDPGNAVKIEINKLIVGYFSSSDAKKYRQAMAKLKLYDVDIVGSCGAAIYGKRSKGEKELNFGVWIDLDLNNLILNIGKLKSNIWQRMSKKKKAGVGCGVILLILFLCVVITSICSAIGIIDSAATLSLGLFRILFYG